MPIRFFPGRQPQRSADDIAQGEEPGRHGTALGHVSTTGRLALVGRPERQSVGVRSSRDVLPQGDPEVGQHYASGLGRGHQLQLAEVPDFVLGHLNVLPGGVGPHRGAGGHRQGDGVPGVDLAQRGQLLRVDQRLDQRLNGQAHPVLLDVVVHRHGHEVRPYGWHPS